MEMILPILILTAGIILVVLVLRMLHIPGLLTAIASELREIKQLLKDRRGE